MKFIYTIIFHQNYSSNPIIGNIAYSFFLFALFKSIVRGSKQKLNYFTSLFKNFQWVPTVLKIGQTT